METVKYFFKVGRSDICYIRYTLESYDGMAIVTTMDPHEALIQIRISPGCEELVLNLLTSLTKMEGIRMDPVNSSSPIMGLDN